MAQTTRARLFDSHARALRAVQDLEAAGYSSDEVSIVRGNGTGAVASDAMDDSTEKGAGVGATVGTIVGGGAGLLAGLGAIAIPGIGPLVAAGWLVTALTGAGAGAATGGLLGTLVGSGVDDAEAQVHAEGVRRGSSLVTVRTDETRITGAEAVLARHNPVDVTTRAADYRRDGWDGYRDDTSLSSPPDGMPGNPPGTAASRAVDRTLGTDISGAHPENRDGTLGNPSGTAAGRAVSGASTSAGLGGSGQMTPRADDDGSILPSTPDGTPGNPRGTELSRGIDEVAGTNISGAHPENKPRRV